MRRLSQLDGLRALAALSVLVYHAGNVAWFNEISFGVFTSELKLGVAVFFALSGFLLYRPFALAHFGVRSAPAPGRYVLRRLLRILPAYWFALVVLTVLPTGLAGSHFWRHAFLVQIYGRNPGAHNFTIAWTLAVELSFYVALPLYAWVLSRNASGRTRFATRSRELRGLAVLCVIALVMRIIVGARDEALSFSLPAQLDWFAPGLLAAILVSAQEAGVGMTVPALLRRPGVLLALAASGFGLAVFGDGVANGFMPFFPLELRLAGALFAGGLLGWALVTGRPRSRVLGRLGVVSYGIYLWHVPVIMGIGRILGVSTKPGSTVLVAILAVTGAAGATLLGALSWRYIERPALALAERSPWGGRQTVSLDPATVPAGSITS